MILLNFSFIFLLPEPIQGVELGIFPSPRAFHIFLHISRLIFLSYFLHIFSYFPRIPGKKKVIILLITYLEGQISEFFQVLEPIQRGRSPTDILKKSLKFFQLPTSEGGGKLLHITYIFLHVSSYFPHISYFLYIFHIFFHISSYFPLLFSYFPQIPSHFFILQGKLGKGEEGGLAFHGITHGSPGLKIFPSPLYINSIESSCVRAWFINLMSSEGVGRRGLCVSRSCQNFITNANIVVIGKIVDLGLRRAKHRTKRGASRRTYMGPETSKNFKS